MSFIPPKILFFANSTVISMILGFITLALFVDGLLRMLGIIPPFMDLDINILNKIDCP